MTFEIAPPRRIEKWADWPDDVRPILRSLNRTHALRFAGTKPFKCGICDKATEGNRYGNAEFHGMDICDPCIIRIARKAVQL